ncbi:hypothetical protein [Streptomyces sp. NPDC059819]|uniref:hypothetical protein n=1 Tax=Streptomyces sp. NPDC059819 TaxID=3346963 RepID=UPI003662B9D1
MNDVWIEPRAREPSPYSPQQIERGRRLVSREDLLTGESQRAQVELGDLLLEIAPEGGPESDQRIRKILTDFATDIGISADAARQYRKVAAAFTAPLRDLIAASGATVSYSVIREAAIDSAGSGRPASERWEVLLNMLTETVRTGERVTAQKYRQAIGARLTVDAGIGLTPERIIRQLDREDVRDAVVACITEPEYLRDVLLTDPHTESKVRETLAEVSRLTGEVSEPSRDGQDGQDDGDERLRLQLRRRVNALRGVVQMHPEQILNVADRAILDELSEVCRSLALWIAKIETGKELVS